MTPEVLGEHVLPCGHEAHHTDWAMRVDPRIEHKDHWKIGEIGIRPCTEINLRYRGRTYLAALSYHILEQGKLNNITTWAMNIYKTEDVPQPRTLNMDNLERSLGQDVLKSRHVRMCGICPSYYIYDSRS